MMERVYKIVGIVTVLIGIGLIICWYALVSAFDPNGRRMFEDVGGVLGWGVVLVCAGCYLVMSKPTKRDE